MSYHFPINAISGKPLRQSFKHPVHGRHYDVHQGRFDKTKFHGQAGIRSKQLQNCQDVVVSFNQLNDGRQIEVYDAVFGQFYQLDEQGNRTDIHDAAPATCKPDLIQTSLMQSSANLTQASLVDIDALVNYSLFSPRKAKNMLNKTTEEMATIQRSEGEGQTPNDFKRK